MAVQVTACVDMSEADRLPALDRDTPMASGVTCPTNTPVAVAVFNCSDSCYRLLPATCPTNTTRRLLQRYLNYKSHLN